MKKLNMKGAKKLTFEEGCNKYIEYCRQRNLREGTIRHYKQSYLKFFEHFDPEMSIEKIDVNSYNSFVFKSRLYIYACINAIFALKIEFMVKKDKSCRVK
jgi:integrase/recombinase XerD